MYGIGTKGIDGNDRIVFYHRQKLYILCRNRKTKQMYMFEDPHVQPLINLCEAVSSDALIQAKERQALTLIEVKCSIGARSDLGRPTTTAKENKDSFMRYLGALSEVKEE